MNVILEGFLIILTGCGVFIAGMNMLGDNLERSAGAGMKKLLGKISGNRFAGVATGAGVTAIIQSSSATTVMAIGFVNAGIMTLAQATAIIMGANIGTTVTGLIVSLQSLGISTYMACLAFFGIMMTFFKSDKIKQIGGIICGFGLIFVGLDLMSSAFKGNAQINALFSNLFQSIDFPLLLILCGAVFTGIIQSSSAATGIVIMLASAGSLSVDNALYIVLGCNIGTCVTAALASMGATTNAKRTAFIHLTFNCIGTVIFTVFMLLTNGWLPNLLKTIFPENAEMQVAFFHVIFNVSTTVSLIGFVKQLVSLSKLVIAEKETGKKMQLKFVDQLLLKTPSIALMQTKKEIEYMLALAKENTKKAFLCMDTDVSKYTEEIAKTESVIDFTNQALSKYFIQLSPLVDAQSEKNIGAYFHVLNDLERIGDHAENFYEIASQMQKADLQFSDGAKEEIKIMREKILAMFDIAERAFSTNQAGELSMLSALENETDELKRKLSVRHYERLATGGCKVELSPYFTSILSGLERVADHLVNVGYSVLNPTGSQTQK